jgi:hypothetical protein
MDRSLQEELLNAGFQGRSVVVIDNEVSMVLALGSI